MKSTVRQRFVLGIYAGITCALLVIATVVLSPIATTNAQGLGYYTVTSAGNSATCPLLSTLTGGGYSIQKGTAAPYESFGQGNTWYANNGNGPAGENVTAICSPVDLDTTVVDGTGDAANCPAGTTLTSGGFFASATNTTYMSFPSGNGWSDNSLARAQAFCTPIVVDRTVVTMTAPPGATTTVMCPQVGGLQLVATGGGFNSTSEATIDTPIPNNRGWSFNLPYGGNVSAICTADD